jgi:hypothetical protein
MPRPGRRGGTRRHRPAGEAGQAAIEYLGVTVASALIVLVILGSFPEVRTAIVDALDRAACTLTFGDDCGETVEAEPVMPLGAVVDPEAPRPELGEASDVERSGAGGAATTLALGDGAANGPCFVAMATPCEEGPFRPPEIIDELPDDCLPLLSSDTEVDEDQATACRVGLEVVLSGSIPPGYERLALAAFNGALSDVGCAEFGEAADPDSWCSTDSVRLDVAEQVLRQLRRYEGEEWAEHAIAIATGFEGVPGAGALRDEECEGGLGEELTLQTALCKIAQGDVFGGALSGILNWPSPKSLLNLGKHGGEWGLKKIFGEASEQAGKEASKRAAGVGTSLSDDVARTFKEGAYTTRTLREDLVLRRVYGGDARQLGRYWSRTTYSSPGRARRYLALPPGNTAERVVTIRVPAGTTVHEGKAAASFGHVGGGNQVYINRVDLSWIVGH